MIVRLRALAAGEAADGLVVGGGRAVAPPRVAFLFTGQGPQYAGMGARLREHDPVFRQAFDDCVAALDPHLDQPLRASLAVGSDAVDDLDEARHAQPAMFAIEYALAAMWRAWGVEPAGVMGHSLGEYAAACVAGVLSLADAARLVALRGRVMDALPAGGMAAVWASEADVAPHLARHGTRLAIAAVNAPGQVVLSGDVEPLSEVCAALEREGVRARRLSMTHAFHSPMVEPALAALTAGASSLEHREPSIPVVSNVTGQLVGTGEITADYWARHARMPVRFAEGLRALHAEGIEVFLEIGPHPALVALGPQCLPEEATCLPTLQRGEDDWACVLQTLSALYARGVDVDWAAFERERDGRRIALPTYPFQGSRHWIETSATPAAGAPDPDTVWQRVVAAGRRQMTQGPLDLGAETYAAKWAALARLAEAYMAAALVELGCFTRAGERHMASALAERWRLTPARRHLLARWLAQLVKAGALVSDGDAVVSATPLSAADLPAQREWARVVCGGMRPLLDYVERCGARLAAILSGTDSPLEALFPDGSVETAEYLYQDWPVARYSNAIARAALEAWVRAQPSDLAMSVLELGAGTGGTTSAMLDVLPADRTVYHFTDVSTFFFGHAARKLASSPFVRTGLLDLERPPAEQGWAPGSQHVVLAGNVLHVTRDLDRTLAHVRTLLAPGGLLIACEVTEQLAWLDVTTMLLADGERFEDRWRGEHDLLAPTRWEQALREHGFTDVAVFPERGAPAEGLAHHVLVARVPGITTRVTLAAPATEGVAAEGTAAEPDVDEACRAAEALRARLAALPAGEQHEALIGYVRDALARVLRLEAPEDLDRRVRLSNLGVDSLMALELRKRLGVGLGLARPLPATLVFDHPSIEAIARLLGRELEPAAVGPASEPAPTTATAEAPTRRLAVADVENLSDEDVESMLLKRLESLR
jgi:malonyl CoA-acyl carrier protein transacylase/SAM-dependent methyltransferase